MALSLLCTFVAHITFLHVFFLPPLSFSLSLAFSFSLSFSLSLSLFLSLSISAPSFSLWLQDTCHLMPFTKYSPLDQSYFFTPYLSIAHIKFTNYSPTIFYDYHPQSCLKTSFSLSGQPSSSSSVAADYLGSIISRQIMNQTKKQKPKTTGFALDTEGNPTVSLKPLPEEEQRLKTYDKLKRWLASFCDCP